MSVAPNLSPQGGEASVAQSAIAGRRERRVAARRRRGAGSGAALFAALASSIRLLRWLLLGLVGLYLTSGFTRVGPQEDALVYRLGKLQSTVHPPGFLFALPAPIDRVVRIPTRTQHELLLNAWQSEERVGDSSVMTPPRAPSSGFATARQPNFNPALLDPTASATLAVLSPGGTMQSASYGAGRRGLHPARDGYTLTADVNLVQASFTARFRIIDPVAWVKAAGVDEARLLIDAACYHAATHALAVTKIDDALGASLGRFREELRAHAQARLDALRLGIELVALEIQELVPPAATVGAFTDVTSAQVEARTAVEQARTYRAQQLPKAESEAYRVRQQAEAERSQLVARAQGETSAFLALLAEHHRAPGLVETRLRNEALEEVLPRVKTKTVLPPDSGPVHLLLKESR